MFKISRKQAIIRLSITTIIITAVISAVAVFVARKASENIVNASTYGDQVTINRGKTIYYNNNHNNTGLYTVHVKSSSDQIVRDYKAYCAQPSETAPKEGQDYTYEVNAINDITSSAKKNRAIKLVIYIREHPKAASDVRTELFSPLVPDMNGDQVYAWTHAIIGVLYAGDYAGIAGSNKTKLDAAINKLYDYIDRSVGAWQLAQKYDTYVAEVKGAQDMIWNETSSPDTSTGRIVVHKCDEWIPSSCHPQGNASFEGIKIAVYKAPDLGNPVATALLDASGTATFDELPIVDTSFPYIVREESGGSNDSYQISATEVEVTLVVDGQRADVTISDSPYWYGFAIVKYDGNTGQAEPSDGRSFDGTTIQLYNNSAYSIVYNGNEIAPGGLIDSDTLVYGGNRTAFTNLPKGNYCYVETAAGTGYSVDSTPHCVNLPLPQTDPYDLPSVRLDNYPYYELQKGNLMVDKIDIDNGSSTTISEDYSFDGVTYQLINKTGNLINYEGNYIPNGGVVATRTLANGETRVRFNDLPVGAYELKESATSAYYVLNTATQQIEIEDKTTLSTSFWNRPVRGDVKFTKRNSADNSLMANTIFSISAINDNNEVTETHIVVADANGVVDTSANSHSYNTNGYDDLYDPTDPDLTYSGYGTWFGKKRNGAPIDVDNNRGALPYGTYIIQELSCDANKFCTKIADEKKTVKITSNNQVVDLEYWDNTCTDFSITTEATDNSDQDHYAEASKTTKIKDHVSYCAKTGFTYTIIGTLMDKETGEPFLVNGEKVEQTAEVTPTEDCSTVDMYFDVDTSELAGKSLVVFEKMYYQDELKASHEKIDDENQTVYIVDLGTNAYNGEEGNKVFPLGEDVTVTDKVTYCLKAGLTYTLKGVIMDKSTGNKLLINGAPVEQTLTFTPEEDCGEVNMYFDFNTTNLPGAKLVVFETLYYNDEPLIEHHDFDDEDQSFEIDITVPETGYITKKDSSVFSHPAFYLATVVIITPISIYFISRHYAKRNLFK